PPVSPHSIIVFPVRDFVTAQGYNPGQPVTVQVLRHGVQVGIAHTAADSVGDVLVNHPAALPTDPQGCWDVTTPDIRQYDVIRVGAVGSDGVFAYDAQGSIHWTATYTGLSAADLQGAVAGESRVLWLGRFPGIVTAPFGNPLESTIWEFGQIPGPTAPCTTP